MDVRRNGDWSDVQLVIGCVCKVILWGGDAGSDEGGLRMGAPTTWTNETDYIASSEQQVAVMFVAPKALQFPCETGGEWSRDSGVRGRAWPTARVRSASG